MRYLGLLIGFLGLLELLSAAPDRAKRQTNTDIINRCRAIFNVSCDELGITMNVATLPPLTTATIPNGDTADCQCVPYYQCNTDNTRNTDGATILDKRISPCPRSIDKCCTLANTASGNGSSSGTGPSVTVRPTPSPIPIRRGCGYRNPSGVKVRIIGMDDNEAQFGEFPWMVAVLRKAVPPKTESTYVCGGSLIHPRAILTAAHSIEGKLSADLIVRAGEWDTQTLSEEIAHQEREVQVIIMHENYNTDNLHNDFAILILKTPVDIAPNRNVICLPEESDTFDATRCTATGWGKDKFDKSGRIQSILKRIALPVVPHIPCEASLRLTRLGGAFILDPSFICAGGESGLDTCTGDGGSPLACPLQGSQDRYVQAGIVSWGIGCGTDRTPGVYSNVAKARRWIDSKLTQYNIGTSSYIP